MEEHLRPQILVSEDDRPVEVFMRACDALLAAGLHEKAAKLEAGYRRAFVTTRRWATIACFVTLKKGAPYDSTPFPKN